MKVSITAVLADPFELSAILHTPVLVYLTPEP